MSAAEISSFAYTSPAFSGDYSSKSSMYSSASFCWAGAGLFLAAREISSKSSSTSSSSSNSP
jgi:hypothetical protein